MSDLRNGPFVAKVVAPADREPGVIDPLAYCTGRELGAYADDVELASLAEAGTVHGRPEWVELSGDELAGTVRVNYAHVDTATGVPSPEPMDAVEGDGAYKGKRLPDGTVAVGRMRPYRNNTTVVDAGLLDAAVVTDSEWLVFEPDDGRHHYWGLVLRSTPVLRQFAVTRGQTRPRLHAAELREVAVPVLPAERTRRLDRRRRALVADLLAAEAALGDLADDLDRSLDAADGDRGVSDG